MPEARAITYSFKELAEILVKDQDIHEGHWGLSFEFAIAAGMIPFPPNDEKSLSPAAIVPVSKIGIHRFDDPNSLTVDAAKVNPAEQRKDSKQSQATPKKKATQKKKASQGSSAK